MADELELNAAEQVLGAGEIIEGAPAERMAVLIVNLDGQMGELPDLIPYDAPEADVRRWATEAVAGGLPGIDAQDVNFTNYVVARIPAKDNLPDRVQVRPKTAFGG